MQGTAISGPNNGDDDDDNGGDDDKWARGCQGPIWPVGSKVNADDKAQKCKKIYK